MADYELARANAWGDAPVDVIDVDYELISASGSGGAVASASYELITASASGDATVVVTPPGVIPRTEPGVVRTLDLGLQSGSATPDFVRWFQESGPGAILDVDGTSCNVHAPTFTGTSVRNVVIKARPYINGVATPDLTWTMPVTPQTMFRRNHLDDPAAAGPWYSNTHRPEPWTREPWLIAFDNTPEARALVPTTPSGLSAFTAGIDQRLRNVTGDTTGSFNGGYVNYLALPNFRYTTSSSMHVTGEYLAHRRALIQLWPIAGNYATIFSDATYQATIDGSHDQSVREFVRTLPIGGTGPPRVRGGRCT